MRVWLLETQPWLHCKVTLHRYLYQLNMLENLDTMSLGNGLPVFIWALLILPRKLSVDGAATLSLKAQMDMA